MRMWDSADSRQESQAQDWAGDVSSAAEPSETFVRDLRPARLLATARTMLDVPVFALAALVSLVSSMLTSEHLLGRPYALMGDPDQIAQRLGELVIVSAVLLAWFFKRGHYTQRMPFWTETRDILQCVALMALLDSFLQYATKDSFSRLWLTQYWIFVALVLMVGRQLGKRLLAYFGLWQLRTLVVASRNDGEDVVAALGSEPRLGYEVVGTFDPAHGFIPADDRVSATHLDEKSFAWPTISDLCRQLRIDNLVLAFDAAQMQGAQGLLRELVRSRMAFAIAPPLRGVAVHGLQAQHFFSHDVVLLQPQNNLARSFDRALKRGFDLLVSGCALAFLAPLLLMIAMMIRLGGGPALFGQWRLGMDGRRFRCLKFRTMVDDAESLLRTHLVRNPEASAEWMRSWKLRHDPRVTRIGRFLRKSSIDELPQLINVLKGEMSLVGPRPIVESEVRYYADNIMYYLQVRPGITGLWQVSGRADTGYPRRVALDCWYVRNWSLWHDIAILFGTVPAVLRQEGAY